MTRIVPCLALACLALASAAHAETPKPGPQPDLLAAFRQGPMQGVEDVVFAMRPGSRDPHWYANFSYYARDAGRKAYTDGGRLARLNLASGKVTSLVDDPKGNVRDPCVDYDGRRIVFSWRKAGTEHYHLFEIQADGSGLKQLTDGDYDDLEPVTVPDGGIFFGSSRCRRWVNCWLTQVAALHRCDADGRNIRMLSSNNDHDNTPWVMPDGRVLYMRWEYVDRSQVEFHHLWTCNPDGSGQMIYFGNMYSGIVMLDAKPVPGTQKVVSIFSPGHGIADHRGDITVVDPNTGPDERSRAVTIAGGNQWRDPWAFSDGCFMAANGRSLVLLDGRGAQQKIYEIPPGDMPDCLLHEPRPLMARAREPVVASRINLDKTTGTMVLSDVNHGRKMAGVKPGEIRKLLVYAQLPMPVHFSGGMEPISLGGTFTLPRLVGTVPVEADGSANFEVPAMQSLFFVAMDEHDNSVKRMQSFATVEPGETVGCVGCHERRTDAAPLHGDLAALKRPPSRIEPVPGVPDVFDFPRDIQPILDKHCLACHDYDKRDGGVILSGDRGPIYSHSYFTLVSRAEVADGRNAQGNRPPRSIGAAASKLIKYLDASHHDVKLSDAERRTIWYWLEAGANYPGTYAAVGSGMLGGYEENGIVRPDIAWPSVKASEEAIARRCDACHASVKTPLPKTPTHDSKALSRQIAYNLTRPEKSLLLLGPLAKAAGGYGTCQAKAKPAKEGEKAPDVFADAQDPDYQKILAMIVDGKKYLDEHKRFDMPGFRPGEPYLREMKRYGILPAGLGPNDPVDPYATDRAYWKSFWYVPPGTGPVASGG